MVFHKAKMTSNLECRQRLLDLLLPHQVSFVLGGEPDPALSSRRAGKTYALIARVLLLCFDKPGGCHLFVSDHPEDSQGSFVGLLEETGATFSCSLNTVFIHDKKGVHSQIRLCKQDRVKFLRGLKFASVTFDIQQIIKPESIDIVKSLIR
jgi:hypothetical protein